MFRYLMLAIFALFAVLATAGVQQSSTPAPPPAAQRAAGDLALARDPADPADRPRFAIVLAPVALLERPATESPATGRLERGQPVRIVQAMTDGWTHAQSTDGASGYVPAHLLTGPLR